LWSHAPARIRRRLRYDPFVPRSLGRPARLLAIVLLTGAAGCEIVDPGPDVGVANRCVLTASFYIERIVPEYIDRYGCTDKAGCHRAADANSIFRLQDTAGTLTPLPSEPLSAWPQPWQENFRATSAQINDCDLAELAPLYSEPAGGDTLQHGGGNLFAPNGDELDLIQAWLDGGT
jgi:hypothetical protein